MYVQAVDYASGTAVFGQGAFADERGQFRVEGLPPGPVHLWVRPTRFFPEQPAFQDAGTRTSWTNTGGFPSGPGS